VDALIHIEDEIELMISDRKRCGAGAFNATAPNPVIMDASLKRR
jgi:NAD dependent epimerase/dehydratase family enzyme